MNKTNKRWIIPIGYFTICECLYLIWELQIGDTLCIYASFALLTLLFPFASIALLASEQIALFLGVPVASFWPRMLGTQLNIVLWTALLFLIFLISIPAKTPKSTSSK